MKPLGSMCRHIKNKPAAGPGRGAAGGCGAREDAAPWPGAGASVPASLMLRAAAGKRGTEPPNQPQTCEQESASFGQRSFHLGHRQSNCCW